MNRYTNFILTVIAVALVGILIKDFIITDANAELSFSDFNMIQAGIKDIASAIRGCN